VAGRVEPAGLRALKFEGQTGRHLVDAFLVQVKSGVVDADTWTVEDHLAGKPDEIVALYQRFIMLVKECGPFSYRVTKTAITLKGSRRGFAGAKPTKRALDGYLDLQRELRDPRIQRASPYTKRLFVHQFRVTSLSQLDKEFAGWIREAYEVGAGAHMQG
jgi:Domain of unknown function (DUF5655)